MKRLTKHRLLITLSASVLLPFSNPGLTDEEIDTADTSKWVCKFCPISNGWFGDGELGLIYVDDPTLKFADYRGLDDDGAYLGATGNIGYRDENGYYFDFDGRNLGLDSRSLKMRGGKRGSYELRSHYNEIPRYKGHGTQSPYSGVGTDTLVLPESYQAGETETLTAVTLASKRKTFGAGFTKKMGGSWKFVADFERQSKEGTTAFSGGLFTTSAAIFPAPVDHTTKLFRVGLEYTGSRGQVRVEYLGSDFNNRYRSVTWSNPFARGFGDEVTRSALEPDNKYHLFSLAGAIRFSNRFRMSGKASVGSVKQNDPLLPYSINPAYSDLALPRDSLDGKLDTSMFNLSGRAYLRLADRLDLSAQYKINERDNKTPVDTYTPILLEIFPADPRSNRPYGYERKQGKLELRYRASYRLRLNAGVKNDKLERTYQSVSKTDEDSFWGELQFSPRGWLHARLKLDRLNRDAAPYETLGNFDRSENPLLRKFNMAERERDRASVEFDLLPTDRFSISLSYYTTDDDYNASVIGLTKSEVRSLNLDFNFTVNKHTNLYAFLTDDSIDSEMSGANGVGSIPWDALSEDTILTWGLGISGRFNDKISYGLDYVSSDSDGDILTDSGAGEAPFPVLETELRNLRVYLHYKLNERWGLGLDLSREEYDTTDWMVDGIGPYDITSVLTMGETSPDYDVNLVRLLATFKF